MLYAIVAVIVLIIDQAVKYWTTNNIPLNGQSTALIPRILDITNVHNNGAAFGIFSSNGRWFFVFLTLVFTVVVIYLIANNIIKSKLGRWMLLLVMAGGLGNCIDRVINGYVVDMFSFPFVQFAVFNIADIFITVCGIIFCIYLIFQKEPITENTDDLPEKVPLRPLPVANERPVRKSDYITHIKKPVIEGLKSIEAEKASKQAETLTERKTDVSITDWNVPDIKDNIKSSSKEKSSPDLNNTGKINPLPKVKSEANNCDERTKNSSQAKKSDVDFTLEDIIAEFKE